MPQIAIQAKGLEKWFGEGEAKTTALKDVELEAYFGEMLYIVGPSGSGKTTLLSVLSGILKPNSGSVLVEDIDIWTLDTDKLADFRLNKIGFVFQDFHLFPRLTTAENAAIPLILKRKDWDESIREAINYLDIVGFKGRADLPPEHAIAVLIGQPASTFALPAHALETKPPATPVGIPSELLERRPDIAAAEREVAQANAQIGVAKAAYFPNILLSGSAGFGNSSVSSWFTWPSRFWSVGPSIAETIFDAGLRRATVQQSRAYYDQTVANYRQTVLTAFQQVENNLASLRILSQAIGRQDAAVEAATRSLHEATVRYKTGVDPYVNVITAQTILLNDQQTAVNYRMQEMVASVQLIKALGGGWDAAQIPSPKEIRAGTERSSVSMHENN